MQTENLIENVDYVKCKICGKKLYSLVNHIKSIHNISIKEYKNKYDNNIYIKKIYEKVSQKMSEKEQHNSKGLAGIRKDIGHFAASTYEANIYRIFQYENKKYKKEYECIFPLKNLDGTIFNYRIDIQDIDGLFGIKNAFIEVKGFMNEKSKLKIKLFKEQYPQYKLLIIGNGDKRNQYYWEPDINYNQLENKYKPLIDNWEDKEFNIKTNPLIFKENKCYDSINYKICPICNKKLKQNLSQHLGNINDNLHKQFYKDQIVLINNLFFNLDFNPSSNIKDYNLYFPYSYCKKLWWKTYSKEDCINRHIKLTKLGKEKNKKQINKQICPVCNKLYNKLNIHIIDQKEKNNEHLIFYNEQISLINKLYYDKSFNENSNIRDFNLYFSYRYCINVWRKTYGKIKREK